ncbi:methyltransferase regulatory domain-containing protein, partial [Desulfococcaceae bacterium HSG8]|nr:methyltransferase regulatory domain-containing protein [Desulfococcaceae bacterium HSG8]
MENTEKATSYDEVPYGSHAFAQSHPDRLAVMGRLFGLSPARIEECRVLELGCASGGNLIPMACHLPGSKFVGVDASARQVESASKIIQDLELKNIRIKQADILDVDRSWETFDYIICHGVYSWVPEEVRDKILSISSENLAPEGIAYVSYNTYPGWHMRGMIRHMMLYHVRHLRDHRQRIDQAKALVEFLSGSVPTENNPYGMLLKSELDILNSLKDWHFFHDHLEGVNDPVYFHDFAEQAGKHGLQYLGESEFGSMLTERMPPKVAETLRKINKNIIATEQYMDFLRNRHFRQTLLCHKGRNLKRNVGPDDVKNFLIASLARPENDPPDLSPSKGETFRGPGGQTIHANNPLIKAALVILREKWPLGLDLDTLFDATIQRLKEALGTEVSPGKNARQALALDLLRGYSGNTVIFRTWKGSFSTDISGRPRVTPLTMYQNRQQNSVVNLYHEMIRLDPLLRHMISFIDGTRDRSGLLDELSDLIKEGTLSAQRDNQPITNLEDIRNELEKDVDRRLAYLAESGLLVE